MKKIILIYTLFLFTSCYKEEMRYCWLFDVTTTTIRNPTSPPYPLIIYDTIDRCWLTQEEADAYARGLNSSFTWYGSGYSMTETKVCTRYYIY